MSLSTLLPVALQQTMMTSWHEDTFHITEKAPMDSQHKGPVIQKYILHVWMWEIIHLYLPPNASHISRLSRCAPAQAVGGSQPHLLLKEETSTRHCPVLHQYLIFLRCGWLLAMVTHWGRNEIADILQTTFYCFFNGDFSITNDISLKYVP